MHEYRIRLIHVDRGQDATWNGAAESAAHADLEARRWLLSQGRDPLEWMVVEVVDLGPVAAPAAVVADEVARATGGKPGRDFRAFLLRRAAATLRGELWQTRGAGYARAGHVAALHWKSGWDDAVAALEAIAERAGRGEVV